MIGHVTGTWRFVAAYGRRWQVSCTACEATHLLSIESARRLACFACGATGEQAPIKTTRAPAPLLAPKAKKEPAPIPLAPPAPPSAKRDPWDGQLPLNERGEIDWREHATWTPAQRAAAHAEDDARMVCEAGGTWLDALAQNYFVPDGDDAPLPEREAKWSRCRIGAAAAA